MLSDTEWNLERIHTRLRIQAAQARYWSLQGLGLWLCSVVAVLLATFTQQQARHAVIWVMSSGFGMTGWKSIRWHGQRYAPRELRDWLNLNIYHGTLSDWLLWAGLVALIPVAVIGLVGWWRISRKEPHEKHIRGAQILSVDELEKRLKKAGAPGVKIGPVAIPEAELCSHFLFTGATGVGKTRAMMQMLEQIARRGDRVALVDPEGELTERYYTPERGDILWNPFDARWQGWSPWDEIEQPEDLDAQAASLFPITPQMQGSTSEFYRGTARVVYRALLERLTSKDPRAIPSLLADPAALLALLAGTDAAALLGQRHTERRQSILQTIQTATTSFRYLEPGQHSWSAKEWVPRGAGWVFFTYTKKQKAAVMPLIGLGLDALGAQFLSSPLNPESMIWMFLDEVTSLPPLATLPELMRQVRKRGVGVGYSIQERSGLVARYGEADTDSILNAPGVRLYMRINDGKTQAWAAQDLGKRDVARKADSETMGSENMRDSFHRTQQTTHNEEVVTGTQLGQLERGEGYLKVSAYGMTKITIPHVESKARQPAFVPREAQTLPEREAVVGERRPRRIVSTDRRAL